MNDPAAKRTTIIGLPQQWVVLFENSILLALWLWLYRPIYPYLATIFTREEFRTNQIVLLAVAVLISIQIRKGDLRLNVGNLPQYHRAALFLMLVSSAFFLLSERFLDINTLSATMFGLASYGFLGLWMAPLRWRQGLPAALLLIAALPFGEHMQTFIGYPVRILTAAAVREGLMLVGVQSVNIDTILVFENGISQVDLPCSGVKSLWTGGIFFLAATWIERRPINARWLLAALLFAFLLLAANLTRVAVLVVVGQVAGWRLLAEMLHIPLGVIGFSVACAAAIWMLRRSDSQQTARMSVSAGPHSWETDITAANRSYTSRPIWLAPVLSIALLALALLYAPRPLSAAAQSIPSWEFPTGLIMEPWPLTPQEVEWLVEGGADSAERWRFDWHGQTGSMLFVASTTWRAHHRPERCFEVYGLTINNSHAYLVAPDFPVRLLSLGKGNQRDLLSAVYWFQSSQVATDDYATRIWDDLSTERQRWILVTVLFDGAARPLESSSLELYQVLRQTVSSGLKGISQP